jgi:hypothetical protein
MSERSIYALLAPGSDGGDGDPDDGRRLPRRLLVALAVVAALLVWAVTYDIGTLTADHRTHDSLATSRQALAATALALSRTTSLVASTTATRDARRQATGRASDELAAVQASLASASQTGDLQALDLATLRTCLSGVSSAVGAIGRSDLAGAVKAITGASPACLTVDNSGGGLVYPFDFPDPFVLEDGSQYYAYATNSAAGNIQILTSSDLTHWTTVGNALPHVASWARSGATWAPAVLARPNSYVLYYSALDGTTGDECISDAVASRPQGPYIDNTTSPLVCQLDQGGSLDPHPYRSADGSLYLTWKSQGANGSPPTLWAQQMTATGTALMPGTPSSLLTPSQPWEGGIVEGPDMWVSGASYDLLYAGDNWQTASYAIGSATCSGPLGPCTASAQPILSSDPTMSGPGGPDVFADGQGDLWLAFAAWLPGKVGFPNSRPLFLRRISINGGTVRVGL